MRFGLTVFIIQYSCAWQWYLSIYLSFMEKQNRRKLWLIYQKGRSLSKSFHNVKWGVVIMFFSLALLPPSKLNVFVRLKASRDYQGIYMYNSWHGLRARSLISNLIRVHYAVRDNALQCIEFKIKPMCKGKSILDCSF